MPDCQTRISQLASIISSRVAAIEEYNHANNQPEPSFLPNDAKEDPPEIQTAKADVAEATTELHELMINAQTLIMDTMSWLPGALKIITRFNVAKHVPTDPGSSISYAELSRLTGLDKEALVRTVRYAAAHRIFREETSDRVAHSAASHLIATNANMAYWLAACGEDMLPASLRIADALERFPNEPTATQTAAAIEFGTVNEKSFYDVITSDPVRAQRFGGAMSLYSNSKQADIGALTAGYDFPSLPEGSTVVDVGGSHGEAVRAIAKVAPRLKFVVQDLPSVIHSVPDEVRRLDIEFTEHDFFEIQPVKGASIYFFRWIFHNWSTSYCIRILRALIPALTSGSKVLVMDRVMPDPGTVPMSTERRARAMDLAMFELGNAKERDAREWEALFRDADERFSFRWVKRATDGSLSLMEAEWKA